jgi:crotonobetainyl-CoA:carnitine CoA-transferase CaiB-like acyl-CoA transferase
MGDLPLSKLRIVELANVVAGPSVGKYLSDFGAEVIKVELPGDGDTARGMGEFVGDRTAWWLLIGRNKRSVTLDLKHPRGREALLRLVETADAVVESFRPGVLERLDLAPDTLHEVNPRLVVVRVSAFGQTGPYSHRPGFGTLAEAFWTTEISGAPDSQAARRHLRSRRGRRASRPVPRSPRSTTDTDSALARRSTCRPTSRFDILGRRRCSRRAACSQRNGCASRPSPRNVYRTREGHYFADGGSAAEIVVRLVGGNALLSDSRLQPTRRAQYAEELDAIVADWPGGRDRGRPILEAARRHPVLEHGRRVLRSAPGARRRCQVEDP